MAEDAKPKLSKLEQLKLDSRQLRGTLAEELADDTDHFTGDAAQLLKHHGSYQQDNRDERGAKNPDGTKKGKSYMMMIRARIPGGKMTADQLRAYLDIADEFADGTLRITTRQSFQWHYILKSNLKATIRGINQALQDTFCACGDVERNVMCCPAPFRDHPVRDEMQNHADAFAEHVKPRTTAYYDIWLRDEETGEKENVTEFQPVEEPIYGERYLPRKFKTGFALPEDNCIDIYTQDLGFLAVHEDGKLLGYNVLVGGGMGATPAIERTEPLLAKRMAFITPEQVNDVGAAVIMVQRDFGNRADRKVSRLKYLIRDKGINWFKSKVEEYYGSSLPEPHAADVHDVDDHIGWYEQGDGKWFLGVNVENGRIKDNGSMKMKTAFREILDRFSPPSRLTALQSIVFCDIEEAARDEISRILRDHGVRMADDLTLARRFSIACPALPTCGLSITESERVMPAVMDDIEQVMARHGLSKERVAVHMTGCPNGCARPYVPDVGLVGKARGKYTLYLGGNAEGTRLAFIYQDMVPMEEIGNRLDPLFAAYKSHRSDGESFGDFCARVGQDELKSLG